MNKPEWMPENPYPFTVRVNDPRYADGFLRSGYDRGCQDTVKGILKYWWEHCDDNRHKSFQIDTFGKSYFSRDHRYLCPECMEQFEKEVSEL